MTAVQASIDLPAPPEEVWPVVLDPHRLHEWVTIHRSLTSADDGPPRQGFRMAQQMAIRGVPVAVSWILDECDPPRVARWTGRGPAGARALIEYRLEASEGGTRFVYTNEFSPPMGPLGRIAANALIGGTPEREAHASLERLRTLIAAS
jgi:uncharacterized protein YndB with AHSA1/START domain